MDVSSFWQDHVEAERKGRNLNINSVHEMHAFQELKYVKNYSR